MLSHVLYSIYLLLTSCEVSKRYYVLLCTIMVVTTIYQVGLSN